MTLEMAIYLFIGTSIAWLLLATHIDDLKQTHYWRGRKDGWDMHRRMINNKVKTDQVFDYDKN
jgi:hypothetical protein